MSFLIALIANAMETSRWQSSFSYDPSESWATGKNALGSFETYRFDSAMDRERLKDEVTRAARQLLESPVVASDPERTANGLFFLISNTSSAYVRTQLLEELAESKLPVAIQVLAAESQNKDLMEDLFSVPDWDDAPESLPVMKSRSTSFQDRMKEDMVGLASYYLVNGSEPKLVNYSAQLMGSFG